VVVLELGEVGVVPALVVELGEVGVLPVVVELEEVATGVVVATASQLTVMPPVDEVLHANGYFSLQAVRQLG